MKRYRFNISMDADVTIEAENREEARQVAVDLLDRGDYDQLLVPDASAYIDDGFELD